MVLCGSLPAFAYEIPSNASVGEMDGSPVSISSNEMMEFQTPNLMEENRMKISYDYQFIGKDGAIYNLENPTPNAACDHTYMAGEITPHSPTSDGGCAVKYYDAKRCTKCGAIVKGPLIKTVTYLKCPH